MPEQMKLSGAAAGSLLIAGILRRAGIEVLETMFFDEAVAAPCEHGWIASAASVRLAFEGSQSGEFLLSAEAEVARSITPAFLGIEPEEVAEGQSSQVLLELANILCGAVLSRLWPEANLRLGVPELAAARPIDPVLHECFLLPEGRLSVSIRMEDPGEPR